MFETSQESSTGDFVTEVLDGLTEKKINYQNNDHELQDSELRESLLRELIVMGGCHKA